MKPENSDLTIKVWRLYRALTSDDDQKILEKLDRSVEDEGQKNEIIGLLGLGKGEIMAGLKKIYGIRESKPVDVSEFDDSKKLSEEQTAKLRLKKRKKQGV